MLVTNGSLMVLLPASLVSFFSENIFRFPWRLCLFLRLCPISGPGVEPVMDLSQSAHSNPVATVIGSGVGV